MFGFDFNAHAQNQTQPKLNKVYFQLIENNDFFLLMEFRSQQSNKSVDIFLSDKL